MMIQRALKWAPKHDHEGREEPQPRAQPVAAEQHQPEEAALEEEGEHALRGEQAAEDVADEARVVGPVHAELELLDDAGRDAEREDQAVDLGPEERQLAPLRVLRPQVRRPMTTSSIRPSPIESGGKMKWKLAVSANWTRDSSSASMAPAHGDRFRHGRAAVHVRGVVLGQQPPLLACLGKHEEDEGRAEQDAMIPAR